MGKSPRILQDPQRSPVAGGRDTMEYRPSGEVVSRLSLETEKMTMARSGNLERKTNETQIKINLCLDGSGIADIATGVGFLDHMLELFTKHGAFD